MTSELVKRALAVQEAKRQQQEEAERQRLELEYTAALNGLAHFSERFELTGAPEKHQLRDGGLLRTLPFLKIEERLYVAGYSDYTIGLFAGCPECGQPACGLTGGLAADLREMDVLETVAKVWDWVQAPKQPMHYYCDEHRPEDDEE